VEQRERPWQQNEQSLSLRACALQDGDARGVFKEVNVDMRQFNNLRFFIHAESMIDQPPVKNGDVDAFIRIGSDFTNNYYEYRVPLAISPRGLSNTNSDAIWPSVNQVDLVLQELVNAKKERDAKGIADNLPYTTKDSKGNEIVVIGTPNIGGAKNIMLGLYNAKKTNQRLSDDGMPKCIEVWFDEMRLSGLSDRAGYAAAGKVSVQMADLGNVNLSGSMHTQGYGNIDQKILQRSQDDYYQYNTSTNLNMGKLVPRNWGVQLPLYVGYTENVSTPRYNPYDQDVLLKDALDVMRTTAKRDSLRSAAQDYTSITSFNLTNVRIQGNPAAVGKNKTPWSIKNFDFTYSYNRQFKHNPLIESDDLVTQRLGVGYTYSLKTRPYEPFKNSIKSKSKWLMLIKDFNLTPLPSTFTHRSELNRIFQETHVRNIEDGSTYRLPPNFFKNFTWTRNYTLRWELMRSVSLDYSAVNISRINEPYGRINTPEKKDSLWRSVRSFGINNSYSQTFNSSYNVPLAKLPLTDWMNLRLNYSATYSWLTAPPVAHSLGNTLGNTQTKTVAGDMNFSQLYNKSKLLRAINAKPASKKDDKLAPTVPGTDKETLPKKGRALPGAKTADVNDEGGGKDKAGSTEKGGRPDGKKDGGKADSKKPIVKQKITKQIVRTPERVKINDWTTLPLRASIQRI
jgi:cell surface protein SprA